MAPLSSREYSLLLKRAAYIDSDIDEHLCAFKGEDEWWTLDDFFDADNWPHYDEWNDEERGVNVKELKKILRGKDMISLVAFALDVGRLIGRAEEILTRRD